MIFGQHLSYGKGPFRQLHGAFSMDSFTRSLGTFVLFPDPLPWGLRRQSSSWCAQLSWVQTTMPHLTACRVSEISVRVSPPYFPLSLPSLSGSPVFNLEDSNKMM